MKKEWIVAFAAACAIALAGCKVVSEPEPIAVQSVTINTTTLTLTIDDDWTRTLVATVYPYNADNRTVTWYSSNPEVADVDYWGGVVTAHSEGTTTISAYAGSRMASCEVTVKRKVVAVNYVTLNETTITLEQNARHILTATAHPDDADDKTATWSSSNPEVARVYSDGVSDGMIVAIGPGTAIITAQVGDKTATCEVTVNETLIEQPDNPVAVEVESITLNTSTLILEPNTTSELTATVTPSNADYTSVTWRTSDYWVATVDNYGTVTTHDEGTATITAQAGGKTAECVVTVRHIANPVTGVMLDKETLTLTRGEEYTLTATLTPNNADYTSVEWTYLSPDWDVLGFSPWLDTCTVTACEIGTVTIAVTTKEGGFTAKCEVTVLPKPIESIIFASSTLLLACGDTGDMDYGLMPIDFDYVDGRTLIWSSSDETIATVDTWGYVTAHKAGKATITATALAGGKTATYDVIVHEHSYSEGKCIECGANPTMDNGTIDENGVLTKYYAANKGPVVIPEGVTGIGYQAFRPIHGEFRNLTSVTIPDSVKSIGCMAFYNCTGLTSVTMGNGVTSIGDSAFATCTSLASVTIPNSVKSIGASAFAGCSFLQSVTISASVTSIGNGAFENCWGEMTIKFEGTLAQWNAIKGSDNIEVTCITCSDGHIGVKDVPAYLKMKGRTVTGYLDSIPENIVIPEGVTSIGDNAFYSFSGVSHNLTSVEIPDSVTSIGSYAFDWCKKLTSVTIGNGVTSIGSNAFRDCTSLKTVNYRGTKKEWDSIEGISGSSLSGKIITGKNANGDKTQWLAQ